MRANIRTTFNQIRDIHVPSLVKFLVVVLFLFKSYYVFLVFIQFSVPEIVAVTMAFMLLGVVLIIPNWYLLGVQKNKINIGSLVSQRLQPDPT
jgi:hypothetical protein